MPRCWTARTTRRRRFAATGILLLPTSPASATTDPGVNATPFNEGGEWWDTDGCTAVPDSGFHATLVQYGSPPFVASYGTVVGYFDFHHACKHHDGCYKYHYV